jgi:hypothetical protein
LIASFVDTLVFEKGKYKVRGGFYILVV